MQFPLCLPALAACFATFAAGQSPHPTASQLEAFERFAETSTARVIWSRETGRIDTDRARAVVTTLTVEVTENGNHRMRGVRIDLTEGDRKERIYTSEKHLDRAIAGLAQVAKFSEMPLENSDAPIICRGSELFWMQEAPAFTASECTSADWFGLVVHNNFNFTNEVAEDFAEVLVAARDELKKNSPRP